MTRKKKPKVRKKEKNPLEYGWKFYPETVGSCYKLKKNEDKFGWKLASSCLFLNTWELGVNSSFSYLVSNVAISRQWIFLYVYKIGMYLLYYSICPGLNPSS